MMFPFLTATGELWGEQLANSSWSGMMGMLDGGEAEMGAANLYVSITRTDVLAYSAPYNLMVYLSLFHLSVEDEFC